MKYILTLFLNLMIIFCWAGEYKVCSCNPESDSLQLVDLYHMTGGGNWNLHDGSYKDYNLVTDVWEWNENIPNKGNNWDFSTPFSTWHGVKVDELGCVKELVINSCGLTGVSFPNITLPYLEELYFNSNGFTGTITDFTFLPNLKALNCSFNDFIDSIPDFSNLPNLRHLNCQNNNLSGGIPDFSNLPELRDFNCSYNELDGGIPDFSNIPELKEFRCSYNKIPGALPDFSNLSKLEKFNCTQNNLSGGIPDFSNIPELKEFKCPYNNFGGRIPDFSNLPNLEYCDCRYCSFTGVMPNFSSLPSLTNFDCSSNSLIGPLPDFSGVPNLTYFQCSYNNLEGPIPDFSGIQKMRSFVCNNNRLNGPLPDFSNLPELKELNCFRNKLTGNIPDFTNLPELEKIEVGSNYFNGSIPDFSNVPLLRLLDVSGNSLTGTIPDFANIPELGSMYINSNFLEGGLPDFSNLPELQILNCYRNNLSGDLPNLHDNCVKLKSLYYANNKFTFSNIVDTYFLNEELLNLHIYWPQKMIFKSTERQLNEGEDLLIDLAVDEFVTTNIYSWYKDGKLVFTKYGDNDLVFSNIQVSDAGKYVVEVTNFNIPKLVLESYDIIIGVTPIPGCSSLPSNISHNMLTPTTVRIDWDEVPGATNYQVRYRKKTPDNSEPWNTSATGNSDPTKIISGLDDLNNYEIRIRAYCTGSWGNYSDIYRFYSSTCDFPDPGSFQVTFPTPDKVKIQWTPVDDATKYQIRYRILGANNWVTIGTTPGNYFKTISGLNPNTTYQYRIRTDCAGVFSQYSFITPTEYFSEFTMPVLRTDQRRIKEGNARVYPNPFNESFQIEISPGKGQAFFSLVDMLGKTVRQGKIPLTLSQYQIQTSDLSSGTYILKITYKNGEEEVLKMVK